MISMKYVTTFLPICLLVLLTAPFITITETVAGGYPWNDNAKPYDFLFYNNFDTHQQTQLKANGELFGFFYITFTGEEVDGIPVAEHCDDATLADECEVGWIIRGKFIGGDNQPTFVFKGDHPIWLVKSRNDIPQPGSFSHFHWLGDPQGASELVEGEGYEGYILELQAVNTFYFRHSSGEELLVMPRIDISTHVNIVGSFPGY